MSFYIFTDLDGTLLDNNNYSFGDLESFINKIKGKVEIIYNTSKTFSEVLYLNRKLKINFPFIVENGSCIFFPKGYLENKDINKNFFRYENYFGYRLTNYTSNNFVDCFSNLKNKYNFSFYSKLEEKKLAKITNLNISEIRRSKKRLFTNPIFWEDTEKNLLNFKIDISLHDKNLKILKGGRFLHILDNYDKGIALKKFIKIINPLNKTSLTTISLGDSENDISMLNLTDYSCVIKSKKKKIFLKNNKIYYSKNKAPNGWKESLEYIFKMEKKNF